MGSSFVGKDIVSYACAESMGMDCFTCDFANHRVRKPFFQQKQHCGS
jgi:hypothetical protein